MSEKQEVENKQVLKLWAIFFEGIKGRQPKSDQELKEWLATDEGKAADYWSRTLFYVGVKRVIPSRTRTGSNRCDPSEMATFKFFCHVYLSDRIDLDRNLRLNKSD